MHLLRWIWNLARSNNRLIIKYSLIVSFCMLKKPNSTSLKSKEKPWSALRLIILENSIQNVCVWGWCESDVNEMPCSSWDDVILTSSCWVNNTTSLAEESFRHEPAAFDWIDVTGVIICSVCFYCWVIISGIKRRELSSWTLVFAVYRRPSSYREW